MLTSIILLLLGVGLVVSGIGGLTVANRIEDLEERIGVLESQPEKRYSIILGDNVTYKRACLSCKGDLKKLTDTNEHDVFECVDCKTSYQNRNLWDEPHWEELE